MPPSTFQPPAPSGPLPAGVPHAPPPWPLKAQLWTFIYSPSSPRSSPADTVANPNNVPEILQGAPPGSYHPLETPHASALAPPRGGNTFQLQTGALQLRAVVLVRYTDTPAGPYDELILTPGDFAHPETGKRAPRITNIYVSTDASVWNGRRNWNIPKHRADFTFTPLANNRTAVRVAHPRGSPLYADGKPFFSAVLTASAIPALPLPGLPLFTLVQPPLLPGRYSHAAGSEEEALGKACVGTDGVNPWLSIAPVYKGHWALSYIAPNEEGADSDGGPRLEAYGDGVGFPRLPGMWRVGAKFEGAIQFPMSTVVG